MYRTKDQLLDVVIVIAAIEKPDDEPTGYAYTKVYRLDLEGKHLNSFLVSINDLPGVAHMENLRAK